MTLTRRPRTEEESRNATYFPPTDKTDELAFRMVMEDIGAKSVLEFGPGDSTQLFLDLGIERIVTCEDIDKWFNVAAERFKGDERVTVLKYHNEFPVVVEGLSDERFDIGFVDSPKGFNPVRKIHPGFADCSRLNTLKYALEHCKTVLLHDAHRPLERGSLGRLYATGQVNIEYFIPAKLGMARITRREQIENGPNPQDTA